GFYWQVARVRVMAPPFKMTEPNDSELTIIKAGTGVLTRTVDGTVDRAALVHLVTALSALVDAGHRVLLVSSGAVGSGVCAMGMKEYPKDIITRQACAAVGQATLMRTYTSLFQNFDIAAAQILLTASSMNTPKRAQNICNTINRLLEEPRIIPIINENDTVAIRELSFGDNDMLTVSVGKLIKSNRIIFLTSVDGLIDPATNEIISNVKDIDTVFQHVRNDKGKFSMGGMASKLDAVKSAVEAGIETHIANGRCPERLAEILSGGGISTKFEPNTPS
ncbi:MAG: glutamate 5-kinase, partial [Luteolibacter sp.]